MTHRTWIQPLAAFSVAVALVAGLSSCTPDARPIAWDASKGALVVGDVRPRLHLWLEYGSPGTAEFLKANSAQLQKWQDSDTMTISYHAVAVPKSSPAVQSYSRMAGSVLAEIGLTNPDDLYPAMLQLSQNVITSRTVPTAKEVQAELAKDGVTIDVAAAVKKYAKSITSAVTRNTTRGPVRMEPTATFNGTFIDTDASFSREMAHQLRTLDARKK